MLKYKYPHKKGQILVVVNSYDISMIYKITETFVFKFVSAN